MYIHDVYYMLSDKMTIRRSNHLFVRVFIFCLLSLLVHVSNSYNYTESRQLEKNHAVSRYRNNTQRLPNYNWKPPDKYGPRKESTEKKVGMEFTKPEDPEQRAADPWIKKMQEISRQEREKWAAHKRNENGKLALDNVEETRKASKLTNDESITIPTLSESEEYDEKEEEESSVSRNLFEESDESPEVNSKVNHLTSKPFLHKRYKDLTLELEYSTNEENAADDEESELEEDSLYSAIDSHSTESISQESENKHIFTNTRRNFEKFAKSDKNLNDKNDSKKAAEKHSNDSSSSESANEKGSKETKENNKIDLLTKKTKKKRNNVNSHHSKPISQSKNRHIPKTPVNTHKSLKKHKLNHENGSDELSVKEHPKQSSLSQDNDNEKSNKNNEIGDEKITTAKPSALKKKKKERKDTTEKPLNHEESFYPGRGSMNVSLPPAEFLKDMPRPSMHRKSQERTEGEKDRRQHDAPDRWGMSVSSPPKEFFENIATHQGHLTTETRSRPSEVKGFSDDRSSTPKSRNLQTDLVRAIAEKGDEEVAKVGEVPSGFYNFKYQRLNTRSDYVDFNREPCLRKLKLLIETLQSDTIDIPLRCYRSRSCI